MIKRIVKMSFHPGKVEEFKKVYAQNWDRIRHFEGCEHVELLQGTEDPNVFFTYSIWKSDQALQTYRQSPLFAAVWAATKIHFNERPLAWTLNQLDFRS